MSEHSNIQWCDSTHNFWRGCTKVSPGCTNCYAEKLVTTRLGGEWGKGKPRVRSKSFDEPLKWNKKPLVCDKCGNAQQNDTFCYADGCDGSSFHRRRVFSLSLGDWLDPEVPIEWLAAMLDVVRQCPNLDWLLCSKRLELWRERMERVAEWSNAAGRDDTTFDAWLNAWIEDEPPAHVMLLASVENQAMADKRIPELLKIPAWKRGLSCEPLLGPVDLHLSTVFAAGLHRVRRACGGYEVEGNPETIRTEGNWIDWVIVGGESGPGARPCNVEWIRSIVQQCKEAAVPFFNKQMPINSKVSHHMAEWPEDLRVREFYQPIPVYEQR